MGRTGFISVRALIRLALTCLVVLLARPVIWCSRRQLRFCVVCAQAVLSALSTAIRFIDSIEDSLAGRSPQQDVQEGGQKCGSAVQEADKEGDVPADVPVKPLEGCKGNNSSQAMTSCHTPCIISPASSLSTLASLLSSPRQSPEETRTEARRKYLTSGAQGRVYSEGDKAVKVRKATTWSDRLVALQEFHFMGQASTSCANILGAESLTFDGSTATLKMDLCEGDCVQWVWAIWASTSFPEREKLAVEFLKQAGTGLVALHKAGIVHGDIKPDNILLKEYPRNWESGIAADVFKIADFGAAFFQSQASSLLARKGTYQYLAPEMLAFDPKEAGGSPISGCASDIWPLGLTFWTIMVGDLFSFEDLDANECWIRQMTPESKRILADLLETDPERRITASALLEHKDLVNHQLAIPRLQ